MHSACSRFCTSFISMAACWQTRAWISCYLKHQQCSKRNSICFHRSKLNSAQGCSTTLNWIPISKKLFKILINWYQEASPILSGEFLTHARSCFPLKRSNFSSVSSPSSVWTSIGVCTFWNNIWNELTGSQTSRIKGRGKIKCQRWGVRKLKLIERAC